MLAELKFYDVDFSTYHGNPNEFLLLSINGGMACSIARTHGLHERTFTRHAIFRYNNMSARIVFCMPFSFAFCSRDFRATIVLLV